ncbi:MAG: ATP-binding protein [bacterium]|nr:ATP-binding protein [bacterium]
MDNNARDISLNDQDWQQYIHVDQNEYLKYMHSVTDPKNDSNYKENSDDALISRKIEVPEWLVDSNIKKMPTLLRGIVNYLKLHDADGQVASCHRFILVGKPGVGKTTLARSIAQYLGHEVVFIHASDLFGKYRNQAAVNLRMLFEGIKMNSSCTVVIIDELHKLFELHTCKKTDDAASATAFWNQIDDLENRYPNIVVIGTANSVENMPAEIKSRFHGKIINIPMPDKDQRAHALREILTHDSSIQLEASIDSAFIHKLVSRFNGYSLRDVQLLIDAAKMFKYANIIPTKSFQLPMIIEKKHLEQALKQLEFESKESLYKRIKPFLKEFSKSAHTAAELGFVVNLSVWFGKMGISYLFPNSKNGDKVGA